MPHDPATVFKDKLEEVKKEEKKVKNQENKEDNVGGQGLPLI